MYWNGGAYADVGPRVTQKSGFTASGPYDIEHVHVDSYALYTNVTPAGALRGFGIPQLVWSYESHTDMIARALKIDPVEFRRKNILRKGAAHATGTPVNDAPLEAILERIAARLNWSKPFDRGNGAVKRGRGLAIAIKAVIAPTTSVAMLNVTADGSPILYCGTVDMGQGSDTAMAQIVGEVLNVPAESVRVVPRDTDITPYDMGTLGSRSLFHMGHAVRMAAEECRAKIAALRTRRSASRRAATSRSPSCSRRNTACRPATSSAAAPTSPTTCRRSPAPGSPPTWRRSGWWRAPAPRSRSTPRPARSA